MPEDATNIQTGTVTATTTPVDAAAAATQTETVTGDAATIEALNKKIEELSRKADQAESWESRSKGNFEIIQRLQEALGVSKEEAKSTDLAETVAELQKKIAENESRATRAEVVLAKKLPDAAVSLLQGNTREELERSADAILALLGTASTETTTTSTSTADANGQVGTQVTNNVPKLTPEQFRALPTAERLKAIKEGRLAV